MKKIIQNILFIALLLTILLFAACENALIKPVKQEPVPDGFGRIHISFGAESARTIFPSKVFDRYEYTFIKDKNTEDESAPQTKTPERGVFVLEAGSWNVEVKAYNNDTLAAKGSEDFTIAAGETKQVDIIISPESAGGTGTFSFNIKYMSGTTVNSFTLTKLSDDSPVTLTYTPGTLGINGTIENLESGFYLLNLTLTKAGLSSGATEVVYIAPNLTSYYGTERDPVIFGSSYFVPQEEGIYVGLITFAGDIENADYQTPILLNNSGRNSLISSISSNYSKASQSGTALFYGVHKGLENLKIIESAFPTNLMSVNMITFTDGLDISSSSRSNDAPIEDKMFNSSNAYSAYIKDEIQNRTIAGKAVTAYSVGVRGNDVSDIPAFQTAMSNLASSPDKAYYDLASFDEVQEVFDGIANGLVIEGDSKTSFNLIIPDLDDGMRIRLTFNPIAGTDADSAEASTRYIEGTITILGSGPSRTFTLTNITAAGGISTGVEAGDSLTGSRKGTEVTFAFDNISGYEQEYQANAKLWQKSSSTAAWQYNSEYKSSGATVIKTEKHSTVIYLVMDASSSLAEDQINKIKEAATSFINSLYSRYYTTQSSSYLTSGVWANGNITTPHEVQQYTFNVTAGTQYNIWWNDGYNGDGSRSLDVDVSAQYSNGASIFSNVDDGWSTPQRFTAGTDGTVTLRVRSYSGYGSTGTYAVVYNTGNSSSRPAYTPPGSQSTLEAIWPIEGDVWVNGYLKAGKTDTYSFDVEAGETYYVWWNGGSSYSGGDGSKSANVYVNAQYADGTSIFTNDYTGWTTPQTISPTADATVYIRITGYTYNGTGTYAVGYTTETIAGTPVRPETVITPLAEDDWEDGILSYSGEYDWYSFDVEAGETYYVWWNDSYVGDSSKTADVIVVAQYDNGNSIYFSNTDSGWISPQSFTPAVNDTVYIRVNGYQSSGSYSVAYNTTGTRPALE